MTERRSPSPWDEATVLAPPAPQADFVDTYVQHLQPPPLPPPAQIVSLPPPPALRERPRASEPPRMPAHQRYPRPIPRMESTVGTRTWRTTAVVIVLFALAILIGAMVTLQVTAT